MLASLTDTQILTSRFLSPGVKRDGKLSRSSPQTIRKSKELFTLDFYEVIVDDTDRNRERMI